MKRSHALWILAPICLLAAAQTLRADDSAKEKDLRAHLVGTWRMVSMKVNGEANDLPNQGITYKHVTSDGFVWLSYDKKTGKIFRAAGGTWTLHGDAYAEKVDYGLGEDFDVVKSGQHTFTLKVDHDRWYQTGKLSNGTELDEVWERAVPPANPAKP